MIDAPLWPLFAYFVLIAVLVAALLGVSHALGGRLRTRTTNEPYESGVVPVGTARMRLSAKFYLIAVFFVIFDLEAVFIYAWAVSARETGWFGYIEISIFIGILLAALVYLARIGALDWGPQTRQMRRPARKETNAPLVAD